MDDGAAVSEGGDTSSPEPTDPPAPHADQRRQTPTETPLQTQNSQSRRAKPSKPAKPKVKNTTAHEKARETVQETLRMSTADWIGKSTEAAYEHHIDPHSEANRHQDRDDPSTDGQHRDTTHGRRAAIALCGNCLTQLLATRSVPAMIRFIKRRRAHMRKRELNKKKRAKAMPEGQPPPPPPPSPHAGASAQRRNGTARMDSPQR